MKGLLGVTALGAALSVSLAFSAPREADEDCLTTVDLVAEGGMSKDSWGDPVLKGGVYNLSASDEYSDVTVQATFYDDSGAMVGEHTFVIEEDVEPGELEDFDVKMESPETIPVAYYKVDYTVICAERD